MSAASRQVRLSRACSRVLRHSAPPDVIGPDAYVALDKFFRLPEIEKFNPTMEDIEEIVENCPKQRFQLDESKTKIRATQGHSATIKLDADKTDLLQRTGGLSRMSRQHVHFSSFEPSDKQVLSGMRTDSKVLIYLDMKKAMEEGELKFYMSHNRVILCPGDHDGLISTKYFARVVRCQFAS